MKNCKICGKLFSGQNRGVSICCSDLCMKEWRKNKHIENLKKHQYTSSIVITTPSQKSTQ